MVAGFQKRAQDRIALGSLFESHILQMAVQNFLGLADHLAGKVGLVVDALLEHCGPGSGYHPGILKMKFIFIGGHGIFCLDYNQSFP